MILVTGGNGVVGKPLCEKLISLETPFKFVSRQCADLVSDSSLGEGVTERCITWDLQSPASAQVITQLQHVETLLHCAPIWLLPDHLETMQQAGLRRIIAFSSTSVLSKQSSNETTEQHLVQLLLQAEQRLLAFCRGNSINFTILRPSMIYGYGRDQNISKLVHFIQRYRCMVLVGNADGLRQPVHADDLVNAAIEIIPNSHTFNKVYNLAGGEEITYRDMVERIFTALNKSPLIFMLPLALYRVGLRFAAFFTGFSYTPAMADRMSQHLNYDYSEASKDFGYQPQTFLSDPSRDIPCLTDLQEK